MPPYVAGIVSPVENWANPVKEFDELYAALIGTLFAIILSLIH